jgi:hypothetical protein
VPISLLTLQTLSGSTSPTSPTQVSKYGVTPINGDKYKSKKKSPLDKLVLSETQQLALCRLYARDYCCIAVLELPVACEGEGLCDEATEQDASQKPAYAWLG